MLDRFKRNHRSKSKLYGYITSLERDLLTCMGVGEGMCSGCCEEEDFYSSEESEESIMPLQEVDIDYLVSFINGTGTTTSPATPGKAKRRRKRKQKRSAENSDPEVSDATDDKVEEFRRLLDATTPSTHRLKPNIT
jgi:hypothetical protein